MINDRITKIIEGVIVTVLGVLIAIFGGQQTMDILVGVSCLVTGVGLVALTIIEIVKERPIDVSNAALGVVLIFIGIFLFTPVLTLVGLINLTVVIIMGLGAGLMLFGIYALTKHAKYLGMGRIGAGAVIVTLSALFLAIEGFRTAFWIIIGVFVALYGLSAIIFGITGKNLMMPGSPKPQAPEESQEPEEEEAEEPEEK